MNEAPDSAAADADEDYVLDVPYTSKFYPWLAPEHLRYAAAIRGFATRPLDGGFDYCELGCGHGLTTNILAAANPDGHFHAVDLNPLHIANGRRQAADAGLTNVAFWERRFSDLPGLDGLPDFDIVALHGVYSWVPDAERQHIREFLRRKLKPGGTAYVSYNAMPGWAPYLPLRRLMVEHAARIDGDREAKARAAVAALKRLADLKAGYFRRHPAAVAFAEKTQRHSIRYAVHEYFNPTFDHFFFADMVRDMGEAGLTFAGDASLRGNYPHLTLTKPLRDALAALAADPVDYETKKDFLLNTGFRRDVYVKDLRPLAADRRHEALAGFRLAEPFGRALPPSIRIGNHIVALGPAHRLAFARAQQAPVSVADIVAEGRAHNLPAASLAQAAETLVAAKWIQIVRGRSFAETDASASRRPDGCLDAPPLNRLLLADAAREGRHATLAGPVAGTGVRIEAADVPPLLARIEARALVDAGKDQARLNDALLPGLARLGIVRAAG
jgi:SAM-dependent methyltransferase